MIDIGFPSYSLVDQIIEVLCLVLYLPHSMFRQEPLKILAKESGGVNCNIIWTNLQTGLDSAQHYVIRDLARIAS